MADLRILFGKLLAERRRAAGLSQERLAFACELHPTYVSQLERGIKMPTLKTVFSLCSALGIAPFEFVRALEEARENEPKEQTPQ